MTDEARAAQREYQRAYRKKNRERVNELNRNWFRSNPEKVKEIRQRYWSKKAAAKQNTEN